MARRPLSTNHVQELEYRLLQLLRQTKAYGPTEIKTRYAAITALASMWGIDLDKFKSLANLGLRNGMIKFAAPSVEPPEPIADTKLSPENDPLTNSSSGVKFDDLEEENENGE